MRGTERQAELGRFLRTRRLALQPAEAGIKPHLGRRRTPGLRREEVAERAAISVSWYTWLEQGRDIHVSDAVLDSIAESLQLDAAQREYVYKLVRPHGACRDCQADATVPPNLQQILDAQDPNPAYAISQRFELVAWNQAALTVFGDFSALPAAERHVLRLLFGMLRSLIVNWEPNARFVLGTFRANTSGQATEPWFRELVEELSCESPDFRCWWSHYDVELRPVPHKELAHPVVGCMVLEQTALLLDDGSGRRLVLYTPKPGTGTETKLRQLMQHC
jgi:transcriptional regulator with XRE-family HTH domain